MIWSFVGEMVQMGCEGIYGWNQNPFGLCCQCWLQCHEAKAGCLELLFLIRVIIDGFVAPFEGFEFKLKVSKEN